MRSWVRSTEGSSARVGTGVISSAGDSTDGWARTYIQGCPGSQGVSLSCYASNELLRHPSVCYAFMTALPTKVGTCNTTVIERRQTPGQLAKPVPVILTPI